MKNIIWKRLIVLFLVVDLIIMSIVPEYDVALHMLLTYLFAAGIIAAISVFSKR